MLSFANAPGNLFNRLGKLGLFIKNVKSFQATLLTTMTDTSSGIVAQYNAESDLQALMGSSYIGTLAGLEGGTGLMQEIATQTINRMVFRDNPQISQTLTQLNKIVSIQEVIRQMRTAGATVLRMTVGGTPGAFAGTGNGGIIVSLTRPFDGLPLENAYAENVLAQCTADSYTGGATAGNESFQLTGAGNDGDVFAFNWPLGSNASAGVSAVSALGDGALGNILTNSDFEDFTVANTPDSWTITSGTPGTNIFQDTVIFYTGTSSLRILGGATPLSIEQEVTLSPQSQYGIVFFLRRDGIAPAAGTLQIDLCDQNGNVVADFAGTNNSYTVNLTGLSTTFQPFTAAFRTPEILPAQLFIRLHLTVALTAGRSVYIDHGSLGVMTQLYTSGPFFEVYSGSVPFVASPIPDYAYTAITNSRGAAGTLSTFQTLWAQLFPEMLSQEFLLPSSAAPTINDALIG